MKIKISLIFVSLFILISFAKKNNSDKVIKVKDEKLESKSIIGDFDGDKKTDTLFEIHTSGNNNKIITEVPSIDDYDNLVDYYFKNSIRTTLKSSNNKINNLDLGTSFGIYCLINIGDNNNDKKDEIALVIDYCDYSSLKSCVIYSLCNNDWQIIKHFTINENSFDHKEGETLESNKILKYLEKKEGKWYYADALEVFKSNDTLFKMKRLKIKNCP
ncbi:MAG: hypothetical protein WCJ62_02925 [Flavobacterium sp.]